MCQLGFPRSMGCKKNGNKRRETIMQWFQETFLAKLRGKTMMNILLRIYGALLPVAEDRAPKRC